MHDNLDPHWVVSFLNYHRVYAGMDHAVIYDAGVNDARGMGAALKEFKEEGFLEVVDFRGVNRWDVWYFAQVSREMAFFLSACCCHVFYCAHCAPHSKLNLLSSLTRRSLCHAWLPHSWQCQADTYHCPVSYILFSSFN